MTDKFKREVTLGLVVGSRQFFNGAPCIKARNDLEAQAARLGIRTLMPPVDATVNGAVQTRDDAKLYGRFFAAHKGEIDGLVISLANFGDEIAIIEMVKAASLGVPILLQACNDDLDKLDVIRRRDAFCGKISACNNLRQAGIAYTLTTKHVVHPLDASFRADLANFVAVCRVVRGLRGVRIGFATAPMGQGAGTSEQPLFYSIDRADRTIVLYRMPIQRAKGLHVDDDEHRRLFIGHCVHRAVCEYLGRAPWEIASGRFDHF